MDEALARVCAAWEGAREREPLERLARVSGAEVCCDRSALLSIVENLLTNARLHGRPASGPTTVEGRLGRLRGRPAWVLEVADRGRGIPRRERQRIFEPFLRGERAMEEQVPGSGLGLSIARAQARSCGGELELCQARGEGARFRLSIPLRTPASPRS